MPLVFANILSHSVGVLTSSSHCPLTKALLTRKPRPYQAMILAIYGCFPLETGRLCMGRPFIFYSMLLIARRFKINFASLLFIALHTSGSYTAKDLGSNYQLCHSGKMP